MMIDFELYRIFKIVAEEENITRASEKLNISQPAVTKHIKNLENAINAKLFFRSNKGLKLNELGQKIYREIRNSVNVLEKVELKYGNNRTINLGTHVTVFNKVLGKKFAQYCMDNKNVKINIDRSDLSAQFVKLEKQELDIIISKRDLDYISDNIEFIKLMDLQDILIVNSDYNISNKKVSLEDLKGKTIYMPRKASVTSKNFLESIKDLSSEFVNFNNINYRTMLELLSFDDNVGLITENLVLEELKTKKFVKLETTFKIKSLEYGIYVNKQNKFKELNSFIKVLKTNLA